MYKEIKVSLTIMILSVMIVMHFSTLPHDFYCHWVFSFISIIRYLVAFSSSMKNQAVVLWVGFELQ